MRLPHFSTEFLTAGASHGRNVLAAAAALALHVLAVWVLASSMSFRFVEPDEQKPEPKVVAIAPRIVPPPPDVTRVGPATVITTRARFRPRMPTMVRERWPGDPALAIWKYLCNRDYALSDATQIGCPSFSLGAIGLGVLDPVNRRGDIGALMGADTATMSLDEAAVARGWVKPPPPKGQSGLASKTDKSYIDPTERFGPLPWEEGTAKGTQSPTTHGQEVAPDPQ